MAFTIHVPLKGRS